MTEHMKVDTEDHTTHTARVVSLHPEWSRHHHYTTLTQLGLGDNVGSSYNLSLVIYFSNDILEVFYNHWRTRGLAKAQWVKEFAKSLST